MSRESRPSIVGPDTPSKPYPLFSPKTTVIAGFGRGSADLGIPTANIASESYKDILNAIASECGYDTGIYYGYTQVTPTQGEPKTEMVGTRKVEYNFGSKLRKGIDTDLVLPMVMSVGMNPFFKNKELSAEIHILHNFEEDFYGAEIQFVILGYIRPELDYVSKEALIEDINTDIKVALKSLERPEYKKYMKDEYFSK